MSYVVLLSATGAFVPRLLTCVYVSSVVLITGCVAARLPAIREQSTPDDCASGPVKADATLASATSAVLQSNRRFLFWTYRVSSTCVQPTQAQSAKSQSAVPSQSNRRLMDRLRCR